MTPSKPYPTRGKIVAGDVDGDGRGVGQQPPGRRWSPALDRRAAVHTHQRSSAGCTGDSLAQKAAFADGLGGSRASWVVLSLASLNIKFFS